MKIVVWAGLCALATILALPSAYAQLIWFDSPGNQVINITIPYNQISDITFNITGAINNGSYPANVTVDINNDGSNEWDYIIYHSNVSVNASSVEYAHSDGLGSSRLYFYNITKNMGFINSLQLGEIVQGKYKKKFTATNGTLGLVSDTRDSYNQQKVLIITESNVIHAFMPARPRPISGAWGMYVAEGGSTYYCNSDHTFNFISRCNLSASEAMNGTAHIAMEASDSNFSHNESFRSQGVTEKINDILRTCPNPCNITVNVTTKAAGLLTFDIVNITEKRVTPASITLSANFTHYTINIIPYTNLTNVSYFYGTMPNVYVVPVIQMNETDVLTENQSKRLAFIRDNLAGAWDRLTNRSHPLNFSFFSTPFKIYNNDVWHSLYRNMQMEYPAIVIVLDVKDSSPSADASNTKRRNDDGSRTDHDIISEIYMNGFSETNKTFVYRYDEEVLLNTVVHELMHSFVSYPADPAQRIFIGNHPAAFTDLTNIIAFAKSYSPTGREGYYEIYSPLSTARPLIAKENINNTDITLSAADRILLGTLTPDINYNYTFYEGNITRRGNKYVTTGFSPAMVKNTSDFYSNSDDNLWWDVRSHSEKLYPENQTSFIVGRLGQRGRALWVFATDPVNKNHFAVFNRNSFSRQTNMTVADSVPPRIRLITPFGGTERYYRVTNASIRIHSNEPLAFCKNSISNWEDNITMSANGTNQSNHMLDRPFNLTEQSYTMKVWCEDLYGNVNNTESITFVIDNPPVVASNRSEWDEAQTTNFSIYRTSELKDLPDVKFVNRHGKISFNRNINISNATDISGRIKIIDKKIWINSSLVPEFNKSAELSLYDINMSNPIIKKDGGDCLDECTSKSYNSELGLFTFNVTGFSIYELVEQCTDGIKNYDETGADCGGSCTACQSPGGDGGGGGEGGGGGGGGGGTSAPPTASLPNRTSSYGGTDITLSYSVGIYKIGKNDELRFIYSSAPHTIVVDNYTQNLSYLTIRSDPLKVILKINEPRSIDINNDGSNDIELRYYGISENKASIGVRLAGQTPIHTPITARILDSDNTEGQNELPVSQQPEGSQDGNQTPYSYEPGVTSPVVMTSVIAAIILAFALIFIIVRLRR